MGDWKKSGRDRLQEVRAWRREIAVAQPRLTRRKSAQAATFGTVLMLTSTCSGTGAGDGAWRITAR